MKAWVQSWQFVIGSYFSMLLFLLFSVAMIYRGAFFLLPVTLIMILVPILDSITGQDLTPDEIRLSRIQQYLIEAAPALFVLGNAIVIYIAACSFGGLRMSEKGFVTVSVGMIGSIGITAAHELVHKPQRWSKIIGRLGLANVFYLHFEINHIRGHHVRVGTDEDQSTAWLGESVYRFVFRTIPGCLRVSWELEAERLNRRGLTVVSFDNQLVQFAALQGAYIAAIWFLAGWTGIALFFLQAAIAIFMLEAVSYIEHYGLMRTKCADGKYEPMRPTKSWDCYGQFSSYLVFQLQRHADHHAYPTKSFASLRTANDAQKLPVGYPLLVGVAMIPPLWRRIMDSRVRANQAPLPVLSYKNAQVLSSDRWSN